MLIVAKIVLQLLGDAARFFVLALRPTQVVVAENLFLRRQLALYRERGIKPRRVDIATRVSLALLVWSKYSNDLKIRQIPARAASTTYRS